MNELQNVIKYKFKNINLLKEALSHSSYTNESKNDLRCNERLEFLGDSVLSIVVSQYLFEHFKNRPEGDLTRIRAALVCEKSLYVFANQIELGKYLLVGKGEEHTGGRERPSILADAFEALIAAIFLDGGMESAEKFIMPFVIDSLKHEKSDNLTDYKTALQEIIQKNPEEHVEYKLVSESGPDHDKRFVVSVMLNSNTIGTGEGRSKKQAEQFAAKEALALMGYAKI